ncbi:ABC transporter permease [Pseudonocardia spinosispora]|uniref:ABC transporter permease n=1 Tax=Pseudonocardia spinosispora TaxID=103441 RepID=UPI00042696B1|nr:ABC transporter permease [Pseudonocardia spinosispora]
MSALVSPRITLATAHRVLLQLRSDRRTVGMLVVVPSVLLVLINRMFDSQPRFDQVGLQLLGIFPFTLMFLITSVAMLRERISGTLERLLTTPMSKLDLLLGYGIAFAVAAAIQGGATCLTAYLLLDLYTPGNPWLVFGITIASAVLGMALGLLSSAFATTEFQAVQFMPAVVMPQVLLGGLFVPREQMAGWLESLSNLLPMTYTLEALKEVSESSLVSWDLVGDITVMVLAAAAALGLAATTLRRRAGEMDPRVRTGLLAVPYVALLVVSVLGVGQVVAAHRYVWTDNAETDGDRITVTAPAGGTLVDWRASKGATLRKDQIIGRIELNTGFGKAQRVIRAPESGVVSMTNVVEGTTVAQGAELAVAYDLGATTVTARVDETDIGEVRPGQQVDVSVDGYPGQTLLGYVTEIQGSTAELVSANPTNKSTGSFQRVDQVVPVTITLADTHGVLLVPGMNVEVNIHKDT